MTVDTEGKATPQQPDQEYLVGEGRLLRGTGTMRMDGSTLVILLVVTAVLQLLQVYKEVALHGQWVSIPEEVHLQGTTLEAALLQHATLRFMNGVVLMAFVHGDILLRTKLQ